MRERIGFERELEILFENGITPQTTGGSVSVNFGKIDEAIKAAAAKFPNLEPFFKEVSYRAVILPDRAAVRVDGESKIFVYPINPVKVAEGFYLYKWDSQNKQQIIFNFADGQKVARDPILAHIIAGGREIAAHQKNATGIFWATQTMTAPPAKQSTDPDALEFPLHNYPTLIKPKEVDEFLAQNPSAQLVIPGMTGGTFYPDRYNDKPLKFTLHSHDGINALVSRKMVGEDFYFLVGIGAIQNYLQNYPFAYAGRAAMGMAIYAQMVVEIGMSFLPIIGPLYSLAQTGVGVYEAYKNWDKMSGWEKAFVGVDVLLNGLPIGWKGIKAVKGGFKVNDGVKSLIKAGLPKREATHLMLASAVFQQEKSAQKVVEILSRKLKNGGRLTVQEIAQVEKVFQSMLKQLPAADRALMTAQVAVHDLEKARQFFSPC